MKIICKICFLRPDWTKDNKCSCGAYLIAATQQELIHNRQMKERISA